MCSVCDVFYGPFGILDGNLVYIFPVLVCCNMTNLATLHVGRRLVTLVFSRCTDDPAVEGHFRSGFCHFQFLVILKTLISDVV
jgi:hypothetical protein